MSAADAGAELPHLLDRRDGVAALPETDRPRRFSPSRADRPPRPGQVFDQGLQHERTALAWERTAISSMVAGVLFARYAAQTLHLAFAVVGIAWVVVGGLILVWSARHYDELHGPLRAGQSPVHPTAARVVGLGTITFTGFGGVLSVLIALDV